MVKKTEILVYDNRSWLTILNFVIITNFNEPAKIYWEKGHMELEITYRDLGCSLLRIKNINNIKKIVSNSSFKAHSIPLF